jgi:peptide/nickel transport system substrate-binding protein
MFRHGSHPAPAWRRRFVAATAALLAGLSVAAGAATASTAPPDSAAAPADSGAPSIGDPDATVVVGFVLEPENLNIVSTAGAALDQVLLDNLYETILRAAPDGTISPGLASLEVSEDGLTYTLALQEGVTFHDGSPLVAADVVWSLDQLRGETGNEQQALAAIDTVEAVDDATVVLTLAQPDNDLAWNLSRRGGAVLKADATDLETTVNGTGPFTLGEWVQGSSITLLRNPDYWGEPAGAAEVVFQYFTDPGAAVNALNDGDVDVLTAVDPDLVGQFEESDEWVVSSGPTNGEFTLGLNNADEALSDPLVRQAITQAINKEDVLALSNGYGTVITQPVPPFEPWYTDQSDLYPYDPEAARAKLEEAGYGDGLALTFIVPNIYPATRGPDYVVSALGDVGIDVDLQFVEFPTWIEQVYTNHDYDLTLVLHVEPRDLGNYANPEYYWLYDNPEVQQLVADAKTAADPAEQVELLTRAAELVAIDAPTVWLLLNNDIIVSRAGVSGYPSFDVQSRFDASGLIAEA